MIEEPFSLCLRLESEVRGKAGGMAEFEASERMQRVETIE